ncbi:hypothetical protein HRI_004834900 [Hibiscus trionum]|uniref:Vesicle transport protein GOT1B n=1 Tax=Hibiscus trionum TaxID=183268 RepID=A0A9W7JEG0_HIBTR|nr:hypothetical protein HRI_004834900 [Hibiscus trionum]
MVSFEMNDRKKIGLGLTGFGIFFSFLGVIFFFDKGLLAMGNILFISGVSLTIGLKSTMQFFMKPQNFKGTISFGVGFFFVVIGWPIIGMILETYGFVVLFSGFWPTLAVFLQRIPILGWLFQQPYVRSLLDRYRGRRANRLLAQLQKKAVGRWRMTSPERLNIRLWDSNLNPQLSMTMPLELLACLKQVPPSFINHGSEQECPIGCFSSHT